jgi:hypothetical protein
MPAKTITKGENYRNVVKILARELRSDPLVDGKELGAYMLTRQFLRIEAKIIFSKVKRINETHQKKAEKIFGTMLRIASSDGSSNGLEYSAINLCSMVVLSTEDKGLALKRLKALDKMRFGAMDLISLFGHYRQDLSGVVTSIDWKVSRIDSESEKARGRPSEAELAEFVERMKQATHQKR